MSETRHQTVILFLALFFIHCSATELGELSAPDTGSDEGDVDVGQSDSDVGDTSSSEDASDIDASPTEEEFEKPSEVTGWEGGFTNEEDVDETSNITGVWAREHMRYTPHVVESWLYPGEYFVRDGVFVRGMSSWLPMDATVFALYEGNYLPLRVVHVKEEDGFPSIEEIESWPAEKFGYFGSMSFVEAVPVHYTLVIPPWAFPEPGAYNIQIMIAHDFEPGDYSNMFGERFPRHMSHTVYYGSEEFDVNPEEHRIYDADEIDKWEHEVVGTGWFASTAMGMFLAPPLKLYDWASYEDVNDVEMNVVLETISQSVTLKLHVVGMSWLAEYDTTGPNLYYVRQDDEIIDTFIFEPGDTPHINDVNNEGDRGYLIPIEIDIPEDETTTITAYAAPQDYEPFESWLSNFPSQSNSLMIKHVSE